MAKKKQLAEQVDVAEPTPVAPAPRDDYEDEDERPSLEKFKYIEGFTLENNEKLERIIMGRVTRGGVPEGGLGLQADPHAVLVMYDREGGYLTQDGVKVVNGAFWDYRTKTPRETPRILFEYNIGGNFIRVRNQSELSGKILEMNGIDAKKQEEFAKKKARSLSAKE